MLHTVASFGRDMRKLGLLLSAFLLLLSTGCAVQKNRSVSPELDKNRLTHSTHSADLTYTIEELGDELIAGSWLKEFVQKHDRFPFVLIVVTDERIGEAEKNNELIQKISKKLLENGKLSIILPKEQSPALVIPTDAKSAVLLRQESGADFLLQCKASDSDEEEFKAELIDLEKAEIIYSKAVINHRLKI